MYNYEGYSVRQCVNFKMATGEPDHSEIINPPCGLTMFWPYHHYVIIGGGELFFDGNTSLDLPYQGKEMSSL